MHINFFNIFLMVYHEIIYMHINLRQTLTTGQKLFKEEKINKNIKRKICCVVFRNRKQMLRGLRKEKQKKEREK
jgi:hypothetical protein